MAYNTGRDCWLLNLPTDLRNSYRKSLAVPAGFLLTFDDLA